MGELRVAIVSRDEQVRLLAARAFDAAPASWIVSLHDHPVDSADVIVCGPDVRCEGAVEFDCADPLSVIELVAAAAGASARQLVVVAGACGGVGTTTLALHLVASLGEAGEACYLDLDECAGGALRLGLEGDHLTYEDGGDVRAAALPFAPGARAVFAPGPAPQSAVAAVADSFDWVVVDGGRAQRAPVRQGDIALMVCRPTVPCARAAHSVLESHDSEQWAVVLNRVGAGGETTRAQLEALIGRRIAVELPCTPSLRDAEDDGKLLTSSFSRYLRRVRRLARALEQP